ncbi:tRNA (cytidine/uridine-2'-O-)-methyltransferase [Alkalispirochaeta americana]|uniref:Putative tRNA (cytidine(34)-2'-O)-methyltransferase n=1 Tax=Alkalispirochaeta americana TaxID=159291 RepID=A0A1N6NZN5_9SPIO|nr:tRNA (cytidine(34)-2'-O)-methyltransferase [Alkalispirochaeta americana]SIP97493.1 tRNA (cytidine/uridine-2'-O-)-methyltransferase [Alkalispirochaeta americana]
MIQVVLYEPEIPPNTGNIARTCAATGTPLHLIEPLGFSISDKHLRRAGLDYWEHLAITTHTNWSAFLDHAGEQQGILSFFSTRGKKCYTELPLPESPHRVHASDQTGQVTQSDSGNGPLFIIFGPETRGLPGEILSAYPGQTYRIPLRPELRSLNLSNAVALVLYDLLRRQGFPGMH